MTWSRALLCWLVAAVLAGVYAAAGREGPAPPQAVLPAPVPAAARAYQLDPATLMRIELQRGDDEVVLERADQGWKVIVPADRAIPGGLVQAFVDQLVDGGEGERIADDAANPAFGFASPQLRVTATDTDGKRFSLTVGMQTPTGTAAYGRIDEQGSVVMVGRNLLYYADLLFGT